MRYMGSLLSASLPTRDKFKADMEALPPVDPADVAAAKGYADLVRDDYAAAIGEVLDTTPQGHKTMIVRYAIGGVAGLVVGGLVGYLVAR